MSAVTPVPTACVHLFIADGMYGCYQRPADDDGQQYYCVQPKYSCRHWAA